MPKPRSKKAAKAPKTADSAAGLRKALAKCRKDELLDLLMELAEDDRTLHRRLTAQFEVEAPPAKLVAATRTAIADATAFDVRDINYNFDYDSAAYAEAERNLRRLVDSGQYRTAMKLALELMEKGSYQVEMSDEGMMTEEIEECVGVVTRALRTCGLPTREVSKWCSEMQKKDCVGFIADRELAALQNQMEARGSK